MVCTSRPKRERKKMLIGIEIINELAGCFSILSPFRTCHAVRLRILFCLSLSRQQQQQQQIIIIITKWHDDDITFRSQLNGRDEMEKKGQEISTVVAVVCGQPGSVFVRVLLTPSTVLPASHCPQQLHHSPSKTIKQEQVRRTADLFKSAARQ